MRFDKCGEGEAEGRVKYDTGGIGKRGRREEEERREGRERRERSVVRF